MKEQRKKKEKNGVKSAKSSQKKKVSDTAGLQSKGGCDAHALVGLGVFKHFKDACKCMNKEIDVVWERLKKSFPSVTRAEVGVNDSHWPAQTLANVCKLKGFHCKRLQKNGKVVF